MTDHNLHRRAILAGLAATAPAAALASVPALSEPTSQADPIFGLIEAHRAAAKAYSEAAADYSRREKILIDEGIGFRPFAVMLDDRGQPIIVYSHSQIDGCPIIPEECKPLAHADLDVALGRYAEVMGDAEDVSGATGDAALEAFDKLLWTTPTTMGGLRALITYLVEETDDIDNQLGGDCRIEALLFTIQEALGREVQA